jgi:hypothetical protein
VEGIGTGEISEEVAQRIEVTGCDEQRDRRLGAFIDGTLIYR